MVSVIVPPAASAALVRSDNLTPAGAVNVAVYLPPWPVTVARCQVLPPSNDTDTDARVTLMGFTSCRCPAVTCSTCRPGRVSPDKVSPAMAYCNVIMGSAAQDRLACLAANALRHCQPGGTVLPASCPDRHVHTVRLAEESGYALPVRTAVSRSRITAGFGVTRTAVPNPITWMGLGGMALPPAILVPFTSISYCPESLTCGMG